MTNKKAEHTPVSYRASDVYAQFVETTENVFNKARKLGYGVNYQDKFTAEDFLERLDEKAFSKEFQQFSKSRKKKVLKAISRADYAQTISGFNRFLRFIYKSWNTPTTEQQFFTVGAAEQRMIDSRKKWVEARDAAQVALTAYKETKAAYWQSVKK